MESEGMPSKKRRKLSHSSEDNKVSTHTSNREGHTSPASTSENDSSDSDRDDDKQRNPAYNSFFKYQNGTSHHHDPLSNSSPSLGVGSNKWRTLTLLTHELLSQVRRKPSAGTDRSETFVLQIEKALRRAPARPATTASQAEVLLRKEYGVAVPFPNPKPGKDTKYLVGFKPPSTIRTIGSSYYQSPLKGPRTLDLCVSLPPDLLQKKDYLNYRVFHKRAYYTACIAGILKTSFADRATVVYAYQDDIDLLPAVTLSATEQSLHELGKTPIRVIVALPPGVLAGGKYSPEKNCVRSAGDDSTGTELQPTPYYNACLQMITSMHLTNDNIHSTQQKCAGFGDACALGRIWLQQRGFGSAITDGGFGAFEWTAISMALLEGGGHKAKPLFSVKYSALNLFRAVLQFLANKDMAEPFVIGNDQLSVEKTEVPMLYYVGTSAEVGVNLLFKMTAWSYQCLRDEARMSVNALNFHSEELCFDSLFIQRSATSILRYDETLSAEIPTTTFEKDKQLGVWENPCLNRLHRVLRKGLTDRVKLIRLETPALQSFDTTKSKAKQASTRVLNIFLSLDRDQAARLIDRGPFEGDKDQKDFQQFWGSRSELRRFKDNAVARESLLWSEEISTRLQIVKHLLHHHFNLEESSIQQLDTDIARIILPPTALRKPSDFPLVNTEFTSLTHTLLNLTSLPLRIHSVQPASPLLSSSSLQTLTNPASPSSINIVITFESSPNWPDALPAIQYTKLALLVKIADSIDTEQRPLKLTTRVGIENENASSMNYMNTSYLDVIFPSPQPGKLSQIVFRIRIQHEREEHLLRLAQTDKSVHGATRDSFESMTQLHKRNALMPAHTMAVRNLCHHFHFLSPTIRLLKKWTASHLLSSLIPDQVVETIAASVFTESHPVDPGPLSLTFVKCLKKLASWDWLSNPLIIDLKLSEKGSSDGDDDINDTLSRQSVNTSITPEQQHNFFQKFKVWRDVDPAHHRVAACIFTSIDATGITWTQIPKDHTPFFQPSTSSNSDHSPSPAGLSPLALNRWQQLARASADAIQTKAASNHSLTATDWTSIFITPTSHYDFLLHFEPHLVIDSATNTTLYSSSAHNDKHNSNSSVEKFKNLQLAPHLDTTPELLTLDPITLYLSDLQHSFHRACHLFYGSSSLLAGGLWTKSADRKQMFRVRTGLNMRPGRGIPRKKRDLSEAEEVMMELNKDAILNEMARMGKGIVRRVEVLK